jgi:hypothetical protein
MPRTVEQHERSLHQPAFCELLPVRDIMHDVIIRTTGAFVAGYELSGINSYYHSDEGRNGTKMALEALIRSLPERSMRMQVRFEITRVPEGPAGLARQAADLLRHGVGCPGQPRVPGGRGVQCPGLSNGLSDFGISRPSGSEVRPIRIVSRPPTSCLRGARPCWTG